MKFTTLPLLILLTVTTGCAAHTSNADPAPTQADAMDDAEQRSADATTAPTDSDGTQTDIALERDSLDGPLNGTFWWWDNSASACQEWTFVHIEGGRALERRTIETDADWSRSVRVYYPISDATDVEPRRIYAAGFDYEWIQPPGPDATSAPGQQGAMGCVSNFDIVEASDDLIRWSESACVRGPMVWYRSQSQCEAESP